MNYEFKLGEMLWYFQEYPHIQEKIKQHWQYPFALSFYINELLTDTRESTRRGFPKETVQYLISCYNHLVEKHNLEVNTDEVFEYEKYRTRKTE